MNLKHSLEIMQICIYFWAADLDKTFEDVTLRFGKLFNSINKSFHVYLSFYNSNIDGENNWQIT